MTTTTQTQKPNNVITYRAAICSGYEPRDYSYERDDIPNGEYHVILDFMVWAKKLPAIDLYHHHADRAKDQAYRIPRQRAQL